MQCPLKSVTVYGSLDGGRVPETEAARNVIIRTALETCTHLYGETQGTIKHKLNKRFRERVFVRCKKTEI